MATSGLKRHLGLTSAQGQEADIAVLAIDPHFQVYGNPSFPFSQSGHDPTGRKIDPNQPRI